MTDANKDPIEARHKIKITDLASILNVSPSTISRALKGDSRISKKTQDLVVSTAKQMGYSPNPFAVNLVTKKSNFIGLILPEFTHHYFSKALNGIDEFVNEKNCHLMINIHNGSKEKELKSINILNDLLIDGLIVSYSRETEDFSLYQKLIDNGVPVVFIDRVCEDLDTSYVITDDFPGAISAINYLVKTGCKKIAHLKGPENFSTTFTRYMGYTEGLKENKIKFDQQMVVPWHENKEVWKENIINLVKNKEIDGIFAFNDYLAYDLILLLQSLGKRIPEDISIIGFSDEPVAQHTLPKITTVAQPAELLGKKAAEILFWHLENPESQEVKSERLATELIIRDTTF